jgi:hypothetical protein
LGGAVVSGPPHDASRRKPELTAVVDHVSVAPDRNERAIAVTITMMMLIDDAAALDGIMRTIATIAALRGYARDDRGLAYARHNKGYPKHGPHGPHFGRHPDAHAR